MVNLPEVLGALLSDGLSAVGFPGASTAGEAVKGYLHRRSDQARAILFDEIKRAGVTPERAATQDEDVAVIYRYLRASWEGSARINLRLLAKAIAGKLRSSTLVADEFFIYADALASLSRDEIILIASMYDAYKATGGAVRPNDEPSPWLERVKEFEAKGWTKTKTTATAGRCLRSGFVIANSAWGGLVFEISSMLIDLCKTVDFTDALHSEGV